jgi:hypothetical protein
MMSDGGERIALNLQPDPRISRFRRVHLRGGMPATTDHFGGDTMIIWLSFCTGGNEVGVATLNS